MARKQAATTTAMTLRDRVNATLKTNVVTLGSDPSYEIEKIPTGSLVLDRLLLGGFARGRHSLLYGDFQVCKSLIVYRTLALAQQRGETTALIDAENVFNARWFKFLGGNPNDLALYPDRKSLQSTRSANELGNVLRTMIQKGEGITPADVVGVDSVASLLPIEEIDHDLEDGDPRVASLARLMPLLLRMLTTMNDTTAFVWTNQWRDKISRIPGQRSTPGGRAMGFFASTMIEMVEGEKEVEEREMVFKGKPVKRKATAGRWVHCSTRKEKTGARPGASMSFLLNYDTKTPDAAREIIDLGLEDGLIEFRGSRYYVQLEEGEKVVHGVKQLCAQIESNDDMHRWLTTCIKERTIELAAGEEDAA